jgi:hypothetical protein
LEENRIPKRVLYMNLETTMLRGRPSNRWQDEVREDGRIVGGGRDEYITERNGKKLQRMARVHIVTTVSLNMCKQQSRKQCLSTFRHAGFVTGIL